MHLFPLLQPDRQTRIITGVHPPFQVVRGIFLLKSLLQALSGISRLPGLHRPACANDLLDSSENGLSRRAAHPFWPLHGTNPVPNVYGTTIPFRFRAASTFAPTSRRPLLRPPRQLCCTMATRTPTCTTSRGLSDPSHLPPDNELKLRLPLAPTRQFSRVSRRARPPSA